MVPVEKVSDIWDDVLPNDIHNEGGVVLKKGKSQRSWLIESLRQQPRKVISCWITLPVQVLRVLSA